MLPNLFRSLPYQLVSGEVQWKALVRHEKAAGRVTPSAAAAGDGGTQG